jgi:hypothetical protein
MNRPRKVHLFYAILFYGFIGGAGAIWIHFTSPQPLSELFQVRDRALTYGLGIGCGMGVAAASWVMVRLSRPAQLLEREFGMLLGSQSVWEIAALAVLSGLAEEIAFRGALQQMVGLWMASVIFAAAHPPLNSRLAAWPVFAFLVGLLMGFELEWTGSLWAPVLTHIVINFVNLLRISVKYKVLEA